MTSETAAPPLPEDLATETPAEGRGLIPPGSGLTGTRLRVVEAALELFAERGFHGASIRDIADGAGIRSASLYDLFPSKAHILEAVVRIGHQMLLAAIRDAIDAAGPDPAEQIRALVRANVIGHASYPMLAMVTNTELDRLPDELRQASTALRNEAALVALSVAMDGEQQGLFDIPTPGPTLAALGSMCLRVPYWFVPSTDLTAEQLGDDYAEVALRVLDYHPAQRRHA